MTPLLQQAAETTPPAGGAALGEVFGATLAVGLVTAALLALGWAHRTRRTTVLGDAADRLGRPLGLPGWVALPTLMTTTSLLIALFGMLWDISLHIGQGRDEGPLANPAHYFILVGLFGVFAAGMLAVLLPLDTEPGPASVRLTRTWRAPVGGVLIASAGFYALLGFPLDDVWHRLFGQDVTLWGPTHLMLITGAGLSIVGILVLEREGRLASHRAPAPGVGKVLAQVRHISAFGGLIIGLSVFQAEYDFGVPQFRLALQPMMIAGAAALALVAARLWAGRGAALGAVVFFLVVRGAMGVVVGPVLGEPTPYAPLYLGSALLVELLGLTPLVKRALPFGVVAGVLIGTVGTAVEGAWSQVMMPLPWGSDVLVEGTLMATVVAVGAGACGALLALGLRGDLPRPAVSRTVVVASVLALAAVAANGLLATVPSGVTATVALDDPGAAESQATVTLEPASAVDDPSWLQITAWQGGGLVVEELERQDDGSYRTTSPVPITGDWKTLVRLHDGRALYASPVWLPADAAIDAEEVPAEATSTRPLVPEIELLQRERDLGAPAWLWGVASLVVLACSIALVSALSWGVGRLSAASGAPPVAQSTEPAPRPRTPQPV